MAEHMIRKQIYLPRRQNITLKRLAKQRGISEAEVIRQALDREAELSVTVVQDHQMALQHLIASARSLRMRPELLQGQPYKFNRDAIYAERPKRWTKSHKG